LDTAEKRERGGLGGDGCWKGEKRHHSFCLKERANTTGKKLPPCNEARHRHDGTSIVSNPGRKEEQEKETRKKGGVPEKKVLSKKPVPQRFDGKKQCREKDGWEEIGLRGVSGRCQKEGGDVEPKI